MPQDPQKPLQSVQASRIRWDCSDFTWESRIPTHVQSGHEYPDLNNIFHKPTSREIYFDKIVIIYSSICNSLTWITRWIPSCNHDEWPGWHKNYKLKSHNNAVLFNQPQGYLNFQHFQIKHFAANLPIHLHHDEMTLWDTNGRSFFKAN